MSSAPNLLTLLRLGLIPFLLLSLVDHRNGTALILFMVAGGSDGLDGLLARTLNQRTLVGQYLDPIADKLLLSTLFIVLTHVGRVPLYVTVLVFSRDLGILLISALLFVVAGRRSFKPSLLGKANTAVQILAVTVVMVASWRQFPYLMGVERILLDATVVLTLASAAGYAWRTSKSFAAPPAEA